MTRLVPGRVERAYGRGSGPAGERCALAGHDWRSHGAAGESEQRREQRSRAWVVEAQRRSALLVNDRGAVDFLEFGFAEHRVVAQSLDVEKTPVGPKTDLAQVGEILEPPAHVEVVGVVDDGFLF